MTDAAPRRRRGLILASSVVALGLVVVGLLGWRARSAAPAQAATTLTLVTVSTQTLSQTVSASGTITPKTQSNLRFGSPGTVSSVSVKVGDQVAVGQPVAAIDPTDLQTAVGLAQANVNAAYANLSTVQSSTSATSAQLAAANSQVAAANAKLAAARSARDAATLTSPIAGTVAQVGIAVGDQVAGGGTSSAGSGGAGGSAASGSTGGQIVVITTDAWTVSTSVSSADIAQLKPGLQAQILPTGARQTVFGTVGTVGVVATTSGGVASFPVTINVTGSPKGLYAGASATVSIVTREVADALVVPTAAVRTEGGQTVVTKAVGDQRVTTPVQIGMVQGQLTQVTSGLAEGDQVVVETRGSGPGGQSTGTRTRGAGQGSGGQGGGFQPGQGGFQPGQGGAPQPPAGAGP